MSNSLREIGENLMVATAYGDAAGLPVEFLSASEIEEQYGYIRNLLPASTHPMFENETIGGVYSDDTQLSIAVAKGLINAKGFDLKAQAESHLEVYESVPKVEWKGKSIARGWGGSTINSMERLKLGVSPYSSGEVNRHGNGALIKLAPLVFWQLARETEDEERYQQYDQLTSMTHDSDISRLTTRIHGDFLMRMAGTIYTPRPGSLLRDVRNMEKSIKRHEAELGTDGSTTELLDYLSSRRYWRDEFVKDRVACRRSILRNTDGKGFASPQTLAMAYGAMMLGGYSFKETVYRAVNLGGDTDSIASIVASSSNFYKNGNITIPDDAVLIEGRVNLQKVSNELTEVALS